MKAQNTRPGNQASCSQLRTVSLLLNFLVKILSHVLHLLSKERKEEEEKKDEGREGRRAGVRWERFRSTPLKLEENFK